MFLRRPCAAAVIVGAALSFLSSPAEAALPPLPSLTTTTCSDVVLYGIRGSGQSTSSSNGLPAGFGPQAGSHAIAAASRLRSSSVGPRTVAFAYDDYPASPIPPAALGMATAESVITSSARSGATRALKDLRGIAGRCPRTRVIVIGYSQGGLVADLLARSLAAPANATPAKAVAAIITLASIGRRAADPGAEDLLIAGPAPWDGWLASRVGGPTVGPTAGRLLQVCHGRDKACSQEPGTPLFLTDDHTAPYVTADVLATTSSWAHRLITGQP